jgi:hypothetical protein
VLLHYIYKLNTNVWSEIARATKFYTILIMFIHFNNTVFTTVERNIVLLHTPMLDVTALIMRNYQA